jgi:hypothetical protein
MPKNFGDNRSSGASTTRVLADEREYKRASPKPTVDRMTPKGLATQNTPRGRPDNVNK